MPFPTISRPVLQRVLRVVVHVAGWLTVVALPVVFLQLPNSVSQLPPVVSLSRRLVLVAMIASFFYLNYWVLIPQLLARRRFGRYFAVVGLVAVFFWLPIALRRVGLPAGPALAGSPTLVVLSVVGLVWVLSSALRITGEWFRSEQLRRQLHADQLAAELSFLKSQVNPHFLFNTLNNVYSLAELKSDDAPAAILKLSELMRYMLYEADAPRVPLAREVEYLRNYVDLQRLRLDPGRVPITFMLEGDLQGHLIEPMLLIPFVENAFKHGISFQQPSYIVLHLRATEDEVQLTVRNRDFGASAAAAEVPAGGVGLQNVAQRLRLLYPDGRHELRLQHTREEFIVSLTLQLSHDSVPAG